VVRKSTFLLLTLYWSLTAPTAYSQYRFDIFNTDNGLPQDTVESILQSGDGYLWLATLDGLVRYDGARFIVFNKANSKGINSNRFLSLYEDTDGALWAATQTKATNKQLSPNRVQSKITRSES